MIVPAKGIQVVEEVYVDCWGSLFLINERHNLDRKPRLSLWQPCIANICPLYCQLRSPFYPLSKCSSLWCEITITLLLGWQPTHLDQCRMQKTDQRSGFSLPPSWRTPQADDHWTRMASLTLSHNKRLRVSPLYQEDVFSQRFRFHQQC